MSIKASLKSKLKVTIFGSILIANSSVLLAQDIDHQIMKVDAIDAEHERQRHEAKGIFGGAVLGGIIGGPPGAIALATLGGLISNNNHIFNKNKDLQHKLAKSNTLLSQINTKQTELQKQYDGMVEAQQALAISAAAKSINDITCCENTALALHFKSNSDVIEAHYHSQLQALSRVINQFPDANIEITGHADQRGTDSENQLLSQNRIQAVQQALIDLGSQRKQMTINAYGETQPLSKDSSLESDFFDRRVNITVHANNSELITQNP